jgi:hypothetical protein
LPGARLADFRSTVLFFLFCRMLVSVHMHYQAELRWQLMRCDELANYGLFAAQVDAADLYFKQSATCLCGYRNSSPHKGVR